VRSRGVVPFTGSLEAGSYARYVSAPPGVGDCWYLAGGVVLSLAESIDVTSPR